MGLTHAAAPVEAIPIRIRDTSPCIHFPASEEDVRAVLGLLPPGSSDGLAAVEFGLGAETNEEEDSPDEPDPLVGRLGTTVLPGYYGGRVLGCYRSPAAVDLGHLPSTTWRDASDASP